MATGRITKQAVDAMAPGEGTAFLWDSELRGFGLRVTANGAKSYVYQYRLGGREASKKRATIGRHGSPWTPATAREEAARLARMVGQGVDPTEHDRERRRQAVDLAFPAYVDLFVELELRRAWGDAEAVKRLIVSEAVPVLRSKALPAIKRSDVAAVLDRMQDRPARARLAFATLRKMFRWAVDRGDLERSPVEGMRGPAPVAARDRILSDRELSLVWRAADTLGAPFGPLFRLLIATGQRREEVAQLDWSELHQSDALWTLPGERAKNGKGSLVPLSALAIETLDGIAAGIAPPKDGEPLKWPRKGLVFTTTGTTAVSGHSRAKSRLDTAIAALEAADAKAEGRTAEAVEPWRIHDLRRTLATGFQRLGVRFEVTEAVLNHVSGAKGGVAGVYQRHDWKDEKRAALDAWGRHVSALLSPAEQTNVIELAAGSARGVA